MTGIPAGLDYAGVEAACRAEGIEWSASLLSKIRTMEHAAIEAMAEPDPEAGRLRDSLCGGDAEQERQEG